MPQRTKCTTGAVPCAPECSCLPHRCCRSPLAACPPPHCLQLPRWLPWLEWPQLMPLSWLKQLMLERELRLQMRAAELKEVAEETKQLILTAREVRQAVEQREAEWKERLAHAKGQRRKAGSSGASGSPARAPPPPAGPWPQPAPALTPGAAAARAAAAQASAAAAVGWASAAAGHEAAAHAAAQHAGTQPAAASASAEWERAAAAWRAAYDALEAAAQADPQRRFSRRRRRWRRRGLSGVSCLTMDRTDVTVHPFWRRHFCACPYPGCRW